MGRELTRTEKAAIRRLVSKWCANYDRDCGCLPLDCECYMFGKCWTGAYCRYFREAVLPLDPALEVCDCWQKGQGRISRLARYAAEPWLLMDGKPIVRRPVQRRHTADSSGNICEKSGADVLTIRTPQTRL
mgnify:CR=1 FL=1